MSVQKLTLDRQLQSLVLAVVEQQRTLDDAWRGELDEFRKVVARVPFRGFDSFIRRLAPVRLVATSATVEARMFVSQERMSDLRVRLATLGLQRRYALTTQSHLTLQCTLTARPQSLRGELTGV